MHFGLLFLAFLVLSLSTRVRSCCQLLLSSRLALNTQLLYYVVPLLEMSLVNRNEIDVRIPSITMFRWM